MSTGQPLETGVVRAACECGKSFERSLDESGLSAADNQEILERAVRSHAYKCGSEGHDRQWGEPAEYDVRLDATGGDE